MRLHVWALLAALLVSGCGTSVTMGGSSGAMLSNGYSAAQVLATGSVTANSGVDQSVTPMSQYQADVHKCAIFQRQGNLQQLQICQENLAENYYPYGNSAYGNGFGYNPQLQYQQQAYLQQLQQRQASLQQQMLLRQQMTEQQYGPVFGNVAALQPTAFSPSEEQVEAHAAKLAEADRYMPWELRGHFVSCKLGADGMIHFVRAEACTHGWYNQIVPNAGPGRCYSMRHLVANPQTCQESLLRDEENKRGYGLLKFGR